MSSEQRIDVWIRDGAGWRVETTSGSGTAAIAPIGCALPLADVYRDPLSSG